MSNQLRLFDYSQLSKEVQAEVKDRTAAIQSLMKRTVSDIIAIGTHLTRVKALLPHGAFGQWLDAEFDLSDRTARRFMAVADAFPISDTVSDLVISSKALYMLASPDVPPEARAEAIERAKNAEILRAKEAATIIEAHASAKERGIDPPELFELEDDFEKHDPTPEHTCPRCGFQY